MGFLNFRETGECIVTQKVVGSGVEFDAKPTFTLPENILREFIQAFANEAKKNGVEVKSESFAQGKLDAMAEHLKDMRTLVFEKPIEIIGKAE